MRFYGNRKPEIYVYYDVEYSKENVKKCKSMKLRWNPKMKKWYSVLCWDLIDIFSIRENIDYVVSCFDINFIKFEYENNSYYELDNDFKNDAINFIYNYQADERLKEKQREEAFNERCRKYEEEEELRLLELELDYLSGKISLEEYKYYQYSDL